MARTSRLDDLVSTVSKESVAYGSTGGNQPVAQNSVDRGVEQIKLLFLEVIGEDEKTNPYASYENGTPLEEARNELRAELRQLVEDL